MRKDSRIYVAGHSGLAGSAICRKLQTEGYTGVVTQPHAKLDLTQEAAVEAFFNKERPEYVFMAAAKVGGIWANNNYPVDFLLTNLKIQNNVIESAWKHEVKGLIFLGSSCIYPKLAPQPIKEDYLLSGPLEPTNEPYAIAKVAGIELCEAYNRQYGTRFLSVMPNNLYGPNDNYDLESSHVLAALVRKFHLAKLASQGDWDRIERDETCYGRIPADIRAGLISISKNNGFDPPRLNVKSPLPEPAVVLWGSGSPRREFLYSDDLADACLFLINRVEGFFTRKTSSFGAYHLVNIGCGQDQTIRELAEAIAREVGFEGKIAWDVSKPDGTPRKLLDLSRLADLDWRPKVSLEQGIHLAYQDYLSRG